MTQQEARQEIRRGNKVTHRFFSEDEYLTLNERGQEVTEEGYVLDAHFWMMRLAPKWQTDWSLFSEVKKEVESE